MEMAGSAGALRCSEISSTPSSPVLRKRSAALSDEKLDRFDMAAGRVRRRRGARARNARRGHAAEDDYAGSRARSCGAGRM